MQHTNTDNFYYINILKKLYKRFIYIIEKNAPKHLIDRSLFIILILIIISQISIVLIFYDNSWRKIRASITNNIIDVIVTAVNLSNNSDNYQDLELEIAKYNKYTSIIMQSLRINDIEALKSTFNNSKSSYAFIDLLSHRISKYLFFNDYNDRYNFIKLYINIRGNIYISCYIEKDLFFTHSLLLFLLFVILVYATIIFLIRKALYKQLKPLVKMTRAVKLLFQGKSISYILPKGSIEIRHLTNVVNNINSYNTKMITHQEFLNYSVAHDLKTSITRIILLLDLHPVSELSNNIKEELMFINKIINNYLDFNKNSNIDLTNIVIHKINIKEFFNNILKRYQHGPLKIEIFYDNLATFIKLNSLDLERILINILDNSSRYANLLKIKIFNINIHNLAISFEDNGPGIDEQMEKYLFTPFKNNFKNKKNFGLGLYIINELVSKNYGNIKVGKSALGGVSLVITFPLN